MEHLLYVMFLGACGAAGGAVAREISSRIKHPYRWKCSQCSFKVSSNNKALLESMKETHSHG